MFVNTFLIKKRVESIVDCYDEILTVYNHSNCVQFSSEQWADTYIIKLMKDLSKLYERLQIQNCLILLLNLFCVDAPDMYHEQGKPISELTKDELEELYHSIWVEINS